MFATGEGNLKLEECSEAKRYFAIDNQVQGFCYHAIDLTSGDMNVIFMDLLSRRLKKIAVPGYLLGLQTAYFCREES